jgi:hypothetical protein
MREKESCVAPVAEDGARPQPSTTGAANLHTPGPWKADKRPVFGEWFVRQDPENWNGMGYQFICALPANKKGTHYGDMFRANARLIAAAPDLLEVCQLALELRGTLYESWFSRPEDGPSAHSAAVEAKAIEDAIRAAISKATLPTPEKKEA